MGGLISAVIFLGLVVWLFEVELVYAIALAIANFVISLAVAMAVVAAMQ